MRAAEPATAIRTAPPGLLDASDFLDIIRKSEAMSKAIGFDRLTASEQAELGALLEHTYAAGYEACAGRTPVAAPATPRPASPTPAPKAVPEPAPGPASTTPPPAPPPVAVEQLPPDSCIDGTIVDVAGDIVKLQDGAVIRILGGRPIGTLPGTRAILFRTAGRQQIWIEGAWSYTCTIVRQPTITVLTHAAREARISEVSRTGGMIKLTDGSVFEVDAIGRVHTMLWLPASSVIIAEESEMLAPNRGYGPVRVRRIN
jgi:hypothetical protein